jgi:hypothetical protein
MKFANELPELLDGCLGIDWESAVKCGNLELNCLGIQKN